MRAALRLAAGADRAAAGLLAALWLGIGHEPLHHDAILHAVTMTFGGTLVGLAHLANLRLSHGHVHDATCAH